MPSFRTTGRPPLEVSAWGAQQGTLNVRPLTDFGLIGTADDTTTLQDAIDWSSANKAPVGVKGRLIIDHVTIKDGCQLICPGPDTTQFVPKIGSTAKAMFLAATGELNNVKLKGFRVDASGGGNAGQHGMWFLAMPILYGSAYSGGLFYPEFEDLYITGFSGEQLWLQGSGDPLTHPNAAVHQFGQMKKVVCITTSTTRRALRITGLVGQFDYDAGCQFDGAGFGASRILGKENILFERSVDTTTGINNSDESPYTHNFFGSTCQSNTRAATIERAKNVIFEGAHFEDCPEGVVYSIQATGGAVNDSLFLNCGHDYEHTPGTGTVTITGGTGAAAFSSSQAATLFTRASVWISGVQYFLSVFNGTNAGTLVDASGTPAPNHAATAFDVPVHSTPGFLVKSGETSSGTGTTAAADNNTAKNNPWGVDYHFVRAQGAQIKLGRNWAENDTIRTLGVTQSSIAAATSISTFGWEYVVVTPTGGVTISTLLSDLTPGQEIVIRASGGAIALGSGGNLDLSPYSLVNLRSGESARFIRQDLSGAAWQYVSTSKANNIRPPGIFVNHALSPYTILPGSGTIHADSTAGNVRLIFDTTAHFPDGERISIRRTNDYTSSNPVTIEDASGNGPDGFAFSPLTLTRAASTVELEKNFGTWNSVARSRMPTRGTLQMFTGSPNWMKATNNTTGFATTGWDGEYDVSLQVDANPSNVPNTVVARDGSGNFSAGTITANLAGNASSASQASALAGIAFETSLAPYSFNTAQCVLIPLPGGGVVRVATV